MARERSYDPDTIYAHDKRCAQFCTQMQMNGFYFDVPRAQAMQTFLQDAKAEATERCHKAAGRIFNPGSTKQLWGVLQEMGAPPLSFTDGGAVALGADNLQVYAARGSDEVRELSKAVLERRNLSVVKAYLNPHVAADARVHPSWNASGQVASRWGVSEPNLMNLPTPRKDPTLKQFEGGVKGLYCAEPGKRIVMFDAKQLEMRIAAYLSGDEGFIASCESLDLHAANAELVFQDGFRNGDAFTKKKLRSIAKNFAFAILFKAEIDTVHQHLVAQGLDVSLRAAAEALATLKEKMPAYFAWQDQGLLDVIACGYVYTELLGRRRYLSHDPSPTDAANFPIQGTAAEVIATKILEIASKLPSSVRCVAYEYDSLVTEAPASEAEGVANLMQDVYSKPVRLAGRDVLFPIDTEISERWS